jgi:hypothetical protein
VAPRGGEEGKSAYARWPVGPRAPRPYGRIGFSKTIDSGTAARPGNPRRLPGIGDETTLNTCSALDQNGASDDGQTRSWPARGPQLPNVQFADNPLGGGEPCHRPAR